MLTRPHLSPRTEFIVRRGVFRWGALVGALLAVTVMLRESPDFSPHWRLARVGAVGVLAWAVWAIIIGWLVGAFLWSFQERDEQPGTEQPQDGSGADTSG